SICSCVLFNPYSKPTPGSSHRNLAPAAHPVTSFLRKDEKEVAHRMAKIASNRWIGSISYNSWMSKRLLFLQ
ncbi:hypothetical protein, partial [Viridibacillus soli]|uniref:hypothetical protein n=1 Tax=Viridibacillus soli TaxID=2798301 RepID=UPI001F2E7D8B